MLAGLFVLMAEEEGILKPTLGRRWLPHGGGWWLPWDDEDACVNAVALIDGYKLLRSAQIGLKPSRFSRGF